MSVPKRFKTNKQLKSTPVSSRVFVKTNSVINLNRHLLFLNFEKKKKAIHFDYTIKLKISVVV